MEIYKEKIIIIDFGGQYNQLIARRVRECNVYCEIYSYKTDLKKIKSLSPSGIILTGGPNSCYAGGAPSCDKELFSLGIPILGICYGAQLMAHMMGGEVGRASEREYGKTLSSINNDSMLFDGIKGNISVWMSHFDYIKKIPKGWDIIGSTKNCPIAAFEDKKKKLYGVQFHTEVDHTEHGFDIIKNFVRNICNTNGLWEMKNFIAEKIVEIRKTVGDNKKVLLALSGGVDSSVLAALLSKAIGKNLICVFVDHGLLRKNEGDEVEKVFGKNGKFHINFIKVNREDRFLEKLRGVLEPEKKRKIIGEEFIRVFEEESKKIGKVDFLAQGTIYPDIVESGMGGESEVIKSHHNVGGLPDYVDFDDIIEPLKYLFKDEVRALGLQLGLDEKLVNRQPFPGPGLGIRIIGEVTKEKLDIVKEADSIYREELEKYGKINKSFKLPNQYFAALSNMKSVGVMGDERTYDYAVVLRAVNTIDFMTCEASNLPYEILEKISSRIVNEVRGVNRVFYDLTSKPPGTVEFE